MGKVSHIIKKNMKLLLRSRTSALIVIIGPLLIILLVGLAFNNNSKYNINVGVYSDDYSELSDSLIEKLEDQNFRVIKYDSEEICVKEIKMGNTHTCLIFPPNLQIEEGKQNDIVIHIDYSKINLAWMIKDSINSQVQERSSELTLDMTSILISKLRLSQDKIVKSAPKIQSLIAEKDSAKNHMNDIQSQLDSLDLTFNKDSFKVNTIKTTTSTLQSTINSVLTTVNDSLIAMEDDIDSAKDDVNSLSCNGTSSITSALNDALDEINKSKTKINSAGSLSSFSELETLMTDVSTNLDKVSTQLTKASEARDVITSKVSSVNKILDVSRSKLVEIKASNDEIISAIQNIAIDDASTIVSPISTRMETIVPEKTHLNYMIPSLIVMIVMFISILLSSTLVMMEKNSKAFFRNFATPTNSLTFVLGTFFTTLLMLFTQVALIIFIYYTFFLREFSVYIFIALLVLVLLISFFTLIGMFIGYLFNSEETATIGSISVGSLFLFLSNMILPMESMPSYVWSVARFNPFVLGEEALKKILLFGQPIKSVSLELIVLTIYAIIFFGSIVVMQSFVKKSYVYHYAHKFMAKKHHPIHDPLLENSDELLSIKAKDPFIFSDGTSVDNLYDFIKKLEILEESDFHLHTSNHRNDFAIWIRECLDLPDVADTIEKLHDKKKMIAKLKDDALKSHELKHKTAPHKKHPKSHKAKK